LSQFKKYQPSGNLKFHNLGISQSLKLRNLMGKVLRISLKRNFTPNSLGCYELKRNLAYQSMTSREKNRGKIFQRFVILMYQNLMTFSVIYFTKAHFTFNQKSTYMKLLMILLIRQLKSSAQLVYTGDKIYKSLFVPGIYFRPRFPAAEKSLQIVTFDLGCPRKGGALHLLLR